MDVAQIVYGNANQHRFALHASVINAKHALLATLLIKEKTSANQYAVTN